LGALSGVAPYGKTAQLKSCRFSERQYTNSFHLGHTLIKENYINQCNNKYNIKAHWGDFDGFNYK